MYKAILTETSFKVACTHVATSGGSLMLATHDKKYWLDKVKAHCTPCTTVYIRNPDKGDSPSPSSAVLVDMNLTDTRRLDGFLKKCARKADKKRLKGWVEPDEALLPY